MTDYTPRPWQWSTNGHLMGEKGQCLLMARPDRFQDIKYGDRLLLQAAPDLYEALSALLPLAEEYIQGDLHEGTLDAAHNALNKAEGR